jgi:hypothetical protein
MKPKFLVVDTLSHFPQYSNSFSTFDFSHHFVGFHGGNVLYFSTLLLILYVNDFVFQLCITFMMNLHDL